MLLSFQAFKAIKCFLAKLEKVSENPELAEEMGKLGIWNFDLDLFRAFFWPN